MQVGKYATFFNFLGLHQYSLLLIQMSCQQRPFFSIYSLLSNFCLLPPQYGFIRFIECDFQQMDPIYFFTFVIIQTNFSCMKPFQVWRLQRVELLMKDSNDVTSTNILNLFNLLFTCCIYMSLGFIILETTKDNFIGMNIPSFSFHLCIISLLIFSRCQKQQSNKGCLNTKFR